MHACKHACEIEKTKIKIERERERERERAREGRERRTERERAYVKAATKQRNQLRLQSSVTLSMRNYNNYLSSRALDGRRLVIFQTKEHLAPSTRRFLHYSSALIFTRASVSHHLWGRKETPQQDIPVRAAAFLVDCPHEGHPVVHFVCRLDRLHFQQLSNRWNLVSHQVRTRPA